MPHGARLTTRIITVGTAGIVAGVLAAALIAGSLTAVAPSGASVAVPISITGTGFNTTASQNEVRFTMPDGTSRVATGQSVATLDAATGRRRLALRVPAGLPVGRASLRVRNLASGEISEGISLDILEIALPDVRSAAPGSSGIQVRITGSPNVRFVSGATTVTFTGGITVTSVAVESATSLMATINVGSTSATGPSNVQVRTSTQTALLPAGFQIASGPPANRAPQAHAGGPYSANLGQSISFSGAASTDPDGDSLSYEWNFGDGTTTTGVTASHTYSTRGAFTATVTVTDGREGSSSATAPVTINAPPTANPGGPYNGLANAVMTFDGSASSDADGDALTYAWSFGDGATGSGQRPHHTYETSGSFTVSLTVDDGRGGTNAAATTAAVASPNRPPLAHAGGPYAGTATQQVSFDGRGSSDPDGDGLAYTWNFGDGGTGTGAEPTHTYAEAGDFTVSMTVSDGRGGTNSAQTSAKIAWPVGNQPPVPHSGGPYSGIAGQQISLDGRGSSDPDGNPLTYLWDFGDGGTGTGATPFHTYAQAGNYKVALTVNDGRGQTKTTATTADIGAAVQGNRLPVANAGGPYSTETNILVSFDSSLTLDPDGDALTYSWTFGDGAEATGPLPKHAYAAAGGYTVTLNVSDGKGGSDSATATVTITGATDRMDPVVTLNGPREALPGTQVTVTAQAADNVGVESVEFTVTGAAASSVLQPPYQRIIQIPDVATPGDKIDVAALARDPSGNTGSAKAVITIVAAPDIIAPLVTLNAPPQIGRGSTLLVSAQVTDAVGVAEVTFVIDGQNTVIEPGKPLVASFAVPADRPLDSPIAVTVRAKDFAGNSGEAAATVQVVAVRDTTPPTVTKTAPAEVAEGEPLTITAEVKDDVGVASVELVINGVVVQTITNPPFKVEYVIPEDLIEGALLDVRIVVRDFSGNQAETTATIAVAPAAALLRSLVAGEVYDDTTGLPLQAANVVVSVGGDSRQSTSDARGRFAVPAPAGPAAVIVSKDGWTSSIRDVTLVADSATEMFDARLTRLAPATASISAVLGGRLDKDGFELELTGGALAAPSDVRLTPLTQQGIVALLPTGWSPVAAVAITPSTLTFVGTQQLRAPKRPDLAAGRAVAITIFDEQLRVWKVLANGTVAGDGTLPAADIAGGGTIAWLVADALPSAPPAAVEGEPLNFAGEAAVPEDATAVINPQPRVIFYKPGVFSDVGNRVAASQTLRSGAHAQVHISESYRFFSGLQQHPEPFTQDLVLFQASESALEARHRVTPSLTFEALALELGVITLDFDTPAPGVRLTPLIGADGGVVSGGSGEQFRLPPGSGAENTSFGLLRFGADQLGMSLPPGLAFVAGVHVSFGGTLQQSGVLSIPRPDGLFDASGVLLARVQLIGGEDRLVLVGAARLVGDRLESDTTLAADPRAFEGITVGGRYVFVRPTTLFGFVTGQVLGTGGGVFAGALVSTPTLPLVSLSRSVGYIAAGAVGTVPLAALDVVRLDSGAGQGVLTAPRSITTVPLSLTANPPTVLSVTPADQATNVPLGTALVARFSRPIDAATALVNSSVKLSGPGGASIAGSIVWSLNGTMLTFRPTTALEPNAQYTFALTTALKDLAGRPLAAASTTIFGSLDTNPPPLPPAGGITATFPDGNGRTTVQAAQGTAGRNDTVTILNVTRSTSTPVILDPNGGFVALVDASLSDKLRLRIVDAAGNEIFVELPRFRQVNADGSVTTFVGPEGGKIEGPNGTAVDVPQGAFPDGVKMTLTYVPEAQFPIQLTADDRKVFEYTGGVKVDMDGRFPADGRYLNLSLAPQGGETPDDQWIVGHSFQSNGKTFFNTVDTARMIAGRITTSSPPCPGVKAAETYGFAKSRNGPVGVNWARTYPGRTQRVVNGLSNYFGRLGMAGTFAAGGLANGMLAADLISSTRAFANDLYPPVVCLPSLSGRATIVPNTVQLTVDAAELLPGDNRVTVKNTIRGSQRILPMYAAALNIAVPTLGATYFEVSAETSAFTSQDLGTTAPDSPPPLFDVTAGTNGQTVIAVESEWLTGAPKAIVVDQVFEIAKTAAEDRGPQGIAFRLNGATTQYRVFFVRDDGSEDELEPLQFKVARVSETQVEVLIDTVERLEASITGYRAKHQTRVVLAESRPLNLTIEGAPGDAITVELTGANGVVRPVLFTASGSSVATGNLILKVLPATLDPPVSAGSMENGRILGSLRLVDVTAGGGETPVPESRIVNGGVELGFVGDPSHEFEFVIGYRGQEFGPQLATTIITRQGDLTELHIPIPKVELTIYDLATLAPVKTISAFAPPRNEPANIGRLENDTTVPTLLTTVGELTDVDPSQPFTLRFSESMDAQSLQQGIFLECGGENISGEIRIFDENRSVAFVPTEALPLGEQCTVYLQVSDASGNLLVAEQSSIALTTFTPTLVGTSPEVLNLRDIGYLSQQSKHTVVGVSRGINYQLITLDVTDPAAPAVAGAVANPTFAANNTTWRLFVVPGVQNLPLRTIPPEPGRSCPAGAGSFTGDLAVIGRYNINMSGVQFYNVTNPGTPCMLGEKYLTADPTGIGYDRLITGTIHLPGYLKGLTAIKTPSAVMTYAAVQEVGVLAAEVGANSPQPLLDNRRPEGAAFGNYTDVVSIRDHLFALDIDRSVIDVLTPTLAVVGSGDVRLQNPRGLLAVEGYTRDDNANGVIDASERRDLIFIAGSSAITILEVTKPTGPTFRASIPFDGSLRGKMAFDLPRKWLAAISTTGVPTVFDISVLDFSPVDERVVWVAPKPQAETVAFDSARGLLFVGRYTRNDKLPGAAQVEPLGVLDVWDMGGLPRVRSVDAAVAPVAQFAMMGLSQVSVPEPGRLAVIAPNASVQLSAVATHTGCKDVIFKWLANQSQLNGSNVLQSYSTVGDYQALVTALCDQRTSGPTDKVRVVVTDQIKFDRIWSGQFSDAETNFLPGGAGCTGNRDGYVLMGTRANTTGEMHARARVFYPPSLNGLIKVGLRQLGVPGLTVLSPVRPVNWVASMKLVPLESSTSLEYSVVAWPDANDNGSVDNGEQFVESPWRFRVVDLAQSNSGYVTLLGSSIGGLQYPSAGQLLRAFINGTVPSGAAGAPSTLSRDDSRLSHAVGAYFGADGTAPITNYMFGADSEVAKNIINSIDLWAQVESQITINRKAISAKVGTPVGETVAQGIPIDPIKVVLRDTSCDAGNSALTFNAHPGQFLSFNTDLYYSFGSVDLEGLIEARARVDGDSIVVDQIRVRGTVTDLYDWDWTEGLNDIAGARVQAGFGTHGIVHPKGGGVFSVEIHLDAVVDGKQVRIRR